MEILTKKMTDEDNRWIPASQTIRYERFLVLSFDLGLFYVYIHPSEWINVHGCNASFFDMSRDAVEARNRLDPLVYSLVELTGLCNIQGIEQFTSFIH